MEDLETILEMDEKHLEQMGVPLGHKLKIMKRIKDCRREKGMEVPESRQGGDRSKPSNLANNTTAETNIINGAEGSPKKKTMKKVAFADEPNFMTGGVGTDNPSYKQPSPTKKATVVASTSLLEGEYNEAEQSRAF